MLYSTVLHVATGSPRDAEGKTPRLLLEGSRWDEKGGWQGGYVGKLPGQPSYLEQMSMDQGVSLAMAGEVSVGFARPTWFRPDKYPPGHGLYRAACVFSLGMTRTCWRFVVAMLQSDLHQDESSR